jgi:hypothetical protein
LRAQPPFNLSLRLGVETVFFRVFESIQITHLSCFRDNLEVQHQPLPLYRGQAVVT